MDLTPSNAAKLRALEVRKKGNLSKICASAINNGL